MICCLYCKELNCCLKSCEQTLKEEMQINLNKKHSFTKSKPVKNGTVYVDEKGNKYITDGKTFTLVGNGETKEEKEVEVDE